MKRNKLISPPLFLFCPLRELLLPTGALDIKEVEREGRGARFPSAFCERNPSFPLARVPIRSVLACRMGAEGMFRLPFPSAAGE